MSAQIDFGYPWWLSYGHLAVLAGVAPLWALCYVQKRSRILLFVLGALALWSLAAFPVARFVLNANGRAVLPTKKFLAAGTGRVLDMGAGTGRSSLMVLEARPQTTVVALDLFAESYKQHFGATMSGQERLLRNLSAAGVAARATVQTGDMIKLPFAEATFDGVVSAFAIDHLRRQSVQATLREAARVLQPGGELLLMMAGTDFWMKFAFGPLILHGARDEQWWTARLQEAGFQVIEQGTRPALRYYLARK